MLTVMQFRSLAPAERHIKLPTPAASICWCSHRGLCFGIFAPDVAGSSGSSRWEVDQPLLEWLFRTRVDDSGYGARVGNERAALRLLT